MKTHQNPHTHTHTLDLNRVVSKLNNKSVHARVVQDGKRARARDGKKERMRYKKRKKG